MSYRATGSSLSPGSLPAPSVVVLLRLVLTAGGIRVVSAGEVRVDGAVDSISGRSNQWILVEAFLGGGNAVRIVEVGRVGYEELKVPLHVYAVTKDSRRGAREGGGCLRFDFCDFFLNQCLLNPVPLEPSLCRPILLFIFALFSVPMTLG